MTVSGHRIFRRGLWSSELIIRQGHDLMELWLYQTGTWAGGVVNGRVFAQHTQSNL